MMGRLTLIRPRGLAFAKELVMAAVRQEGYALCYASEALKGDKELVMAAVRQNGWSLRSASEALKGDKDVAMAALQSLKREHRDAWESFDRFPECSLKVVASLVDALEAADAVAGAMRAQFEHEVAVEVIDVDSGVATREPAPKRQRTETRTSGLRALSEVADSGAVRTAVVKEEAAAARRAAEDAEDRTTCISCMQGDLQVCFMPCSHLCVCATCADAITSRGGPCPVCRTPIRERLTVYISGAR